MVDFEWMDGRGSGVAESQKIIKYSFTWHGHISRKSLLASVHTMQDIEP
jgi:hypothetical protein